MLFSTILWIAVQKCFNFCGADFNDILNEAEQTNKWLETKKETYMAVKSRVQNAIEMVVVAFF